MLQEKKGECLLELANRSMSDEISQKKLENLKIKDAAKFELLIEPQKSDQNDQKKSLSFTSLQIKDEETPKGQNFEDRVVRSSDPVIIPQVSLSHRIPDSTTVNYQVLADHDPQTSKTACKKA